MNSQSVNTEEKEKPKDIQDPVKRTGDSRVQTAAPHPNLTGLMSQMATVNKVSNSFRRE